MTPAHLPPGHPPGLVRAHLPDGGGALFAGIDRRRPPPSWPKPSRTGELRILPQMLYPSSGRFITRLMEDWVNHPGDRGRLETVADILSLIRAAGVAFPAREPPGPLYWGT